MKDIIFIVLLMPLFAKADMSNQLEKNSEQVKSSIVSGVESNLLKKQERLGIQLKINSLRTQIGSTTNSQQKAALQGEVNTLSRQQKNL